MKVSEIVGSSDRRPQLRRVGVLFHPDEDHHVMAAAIDLYRHLGIDVEVQGLLIFVRCGQPISGPLMALLERRTGRPGFNEWWDIP